MKKKELLAMKKMSATPKILALVREDKKEQKVVRYTYRSGSIVYDTYQRYQYYRAVAENGILKVAVFSRKHLAAGVLIPEYEIYLSKSEDTHLTFEPAQEKWRTAKVDRLNYDLDSGYCYGNKPWASEETKRLVNEYLGTGTLEVKAAILEFQTRVEKNRLAKKHKSELEAIDEVMNTVPKIPKDFDNWVLESAFIHERYLIYRYGNKERRAYCTHCGRTVRLKETPKHNKNGICPVCRTNALLKAWNKQKYLIDEKRVGILQRLTDESGYVLRKFLCKTKRTIKNDWTLEFAGCWEEVRIKLDNNFRQVKTYVWGEYKTTGIERWCHEIVNYWYGSITDECVLYYRNIKKLRKEAGLQYIPIEMILRKNQGCYCNAAGMMRTYAQYPQMEYLIKLGLYRLVWGMTSGNYIGISDRTLDWNQRKPWKVLRVTKEQLTMCIHMDISGRELEVLQKANEYNVKLSAEQVRFFTKELGTGIVGEILKYGHPERFMGYITELLADKNNRVGDYIDYLNDIEKLNVPTGKDVLFPRNFAETHARIALQRQEREDKLKKLDIERKDELLKEMLPALSEIYDMQDEHFLIVLPTCKEDFNREGRENHNCVGGSYFDRMLKGDCCVMFLREKEDPNKAFCTVEMKGSRIIQCRAKLNREAPPEALEFMQKFSQKVEKRIQEKQKALMTAV